MNNTTGFHQMLQVPGSKKPARLNTKPAQLEISSMNSAAKVALCEWMQEGEGHIRLAAGAAIGKQPPAPRWAAHISFRSLQNAIKTAVQRKEDRTASLWASPGLTRHQAVGCTLEVCCQ